MKTYTHSIALALSLLAMFVSIGAFAATKSAASIPSIDLIQPPELASMLTNASTAKPLILQVGFRKLYDQAHIPGAEYAGPGSDADGLRILSQRVATLPKEAAIIIYCGCCPWSHCPNIAAAYDKLHALGFNHLKVLYIAHNFGSDWVDRGYPTVMGK
jgi:thiosulfate/3-mercaptopyruvate sulfurtransferase